MSARSIVGELVRERRRNIGLTQEQLSAAAGVSLGALRDLEQGRTRCPRWGSVAVIASALGMDRHQQAELASAWQAGSQEGTRDMPRPRRRRGHAGPRCASACSAC